MFAVVGASFAIFTHTLNRSHPLVKLSFPSTRKALIPSVSRCFSHNHGVNSILLPRRCQALRIATVAEEEAAAEMEEASPEVVDSAPVEGETEAVEGQTEEVGATIL